MTNANSPSGSFARRNRRRRRAAPWQEYLTDIPEQPRNRKQKSPALAARLRNHLRRGPQRLEGRRSDRARTVFAVAQKERGLDHQQEFRIAPSQVGSLPDPVDVEAIASILGGQEYYVYTYAAASGVAARKAVPRHPGAALDSPDRRYRPALYPKAPSPDLRPLAWDDGDRWKLWLDVRQDDRDQWKITGRCAAAENAWN